MKTKDTKTTTKIVKTKISDNQSVTNITSNSHSTFKLSTANKIGMALPSTKTFFALLVLLPILMLALCILFDFDNVTYFEQITVNGVELTRFDVFHYLKGIENAALTFKSALKNATIKNAWPNWSNNFNFNDIVNGLKSIVNILVLIVNLIIGFINTGLIAIQLIIFLLQLVVAVLGLNVYANNILSTITQTLSTIAVNLNIPYIPFIQI